MPRTVKVDLAKDQQKLRRFILKRIEDYPGTGDDGPGDSGDPIQLVTLGYSIEQSGDVTLVFDTRPDADNDGEWNSFICDATVIEFPKWCKLVESWSEDKACEVTLPDGATISPSQETCNRESIAGIFGEVLRDTMIQLRDEGALKSLPLVPEAFLIVEESDGYWCWPSSYKKRKQVQLRLDSPLLKGKAAALEDDDDRKAALLERTRKLTVDEQIDFWIKELNRRATGKRSELEKVFLESTYPGWGNDFALDELERIGAPSVIPLLKLVRRLARRLEWDGDCPQTEIRETPVQNITVPSIWKIGDIGIASEEVEKLLHQIIRVGCKANVGRTLWGILPFHAARCLAKLFDKYPEPTWDGSCNRLLDAEQFQRRPRKRAT